MTGVRAAAIALLAVGACARTAGAESFRDVFRGDGATPSPTAALGSAMADTVARALPVIPGSPGLTFRYDPSSGGFERDTWILGQIYLEQARTVGKGKWNVMASYQHVSLDAVQGQEIDGLQDNDQAIVVDQARSDGTRQTGFVKFDRYEVSLAVDMVTLAATYGVSDDIDLSFTLPILTSRLHVQARQRDFRFDPNGSLALVRRQNTNTELSHAGVGDLVIRGKYNFFTHPWGDVATAVALRMPTGSQDNFQGTGSWELSPLLYGTTRRFPLGGGVALQAFLNGGVDFNLDDVDRSQGRFGVGVDFAFGQRGTFSLAFLGREPFHGFTAAGFFDQPRLDPKNNTCQPNPSDPNRVRKSSCPTAPLFGLETARPSYYSFSIGGRVNLWRDTVFGFANVLIPLLDEGISTNPIPLVGFEATF